VPLSFFSLSLLVFDTTKQQPDKNQVTVSETKCVHSQYSFLFYKSNSEWRLGYLVESLWERERASERLWCRCFEDDGTFEIDHWSQSADSRTATIKAGVEFMVV